MREVAAVLPAGAPVASARSAALADRLISADWLISRMWPLWLEMLAVPAAGTAPRLACVARRAAVLHRPGARMCSTDAAEPLFSVLQAGLARAAEREQRKRASLEKEAAAATKAEQLGRWGTLVTSNLYRIPAGATSAVVEDWEQGGKEVTLTFDAKIGSPQLEAEKAFAAARKLRRGSVVVAELLEESRRTSASLGEWQARVEQSANDPYALGSLQAQLVKRAKKLNLKLAELQPSGDAPKKAALWLGLGLGLRLALGLG